MVNQRKGKGKSMVGKRKYMSLSFIDVPGPG